MRQPVYKGNIDEMPGLCAGIRYTKLRITTMTLLLCGCAAFVLAVLGKRHMNKT